MSPRPFTDYVIAPAIREGATAMDGVFDDEDNADEGN
jgi:hypothetical protein